MKKIVIVCFVAVLGACSSGSNTDKVKAGIMEFNKTLTVGQALDNWKDCTKKEWREFQSDNGVAVVEFTCHHNLVPYVTKLREMLPEPADKELLYLDVVDSTSVIQFTLNKDDTFQADNAQANIVWGDGSKFGGPKDATDVLKQAYANEANWDAREIQSELAANMASFVLQKAKPSPHTRPKTTAVPAPAAQPVTAAEPEEVVEVDDGTFPMTDYEQATGNELGPSFDCAKAATFSEKAVCDNEQLGRLDGALAYNYNATRDSNVGDGARDDMKKTQRAWIAEKNKCGDAECLITAYRARIEQICQYPVISGVRPGCMVENKR